MELKNKIILITGAGSGLGKALAIKAGQAGAKVICGGRRKDRIQQTAEEVTKAGGVGTAVEMDVTDPKSVEKGVKQAEKAGPIEILINNAGINIRGPIDELDFEQFRQVLSTNVEAPWLVTRAFIETMKQKRYGRIIHIASTLGLVGLANRTPYTASKGAVVQLTRAMALEFAPWNITCNAICPGPFLTEMNQGVAEQTDVKNNIVGATVMGRWGELSEIQGAAIYLASSASSFTTGSMLVVDGGWTAR